MKDIIICDLDGTLSLTQHRQHFLPKDWKSFFEVCVDDPPNIPVINLLNTLNCIGYKIYIFSGRSEVVKEQTIKWLWKHKVFYKELYMRKADDFRPDNILKKEMFDLYVDKDRLAWIFDDRDKVLQMWRKEKLTCFQVANGDF